MSPRVTGVYKSEVRGRIIQAAIESFSRSGFDRTKMDDISKRLGLSKGTLYLYFKSKEDLFLAICEHYLDALKKQMPTFGRPEDLLLDAGRFYDYFRKLEAENEKVMLEMIVESTRNPKLRKLLYEHRLKVKEVIIGYLRVQVENQSIKKETDIASMASAYVALHDGIMLSGLIGLPEEDCKKAWLAMVRASIVGIS